MVFLKIFMVELGKIKGAYSMERNFGKYDIPPTPHELKKVA